MVPLHHVHSKSLQYLIYSQKSSLGLDFNSANRPVHKSINYLWRGIKKSRAVRQKNGKGCTTVYVQYLGMHFFPSNCPVVTQCDEQFAAHGFPYLESESL